jgi:hypothetical protein
MNQYDHDHRHMLLEKMTEEKDGKCSMRQHVTCMIQSLLDTIKLVP